MNFTRLASISFVLGTLYYYQMEASIPRHVNCSFSAGLMTDILAFIIGGYVSLIGYRIKNKILFMLGNAIIVEHVWQAIHHKI